MTVAVSASHEWQDACAPTTDGGQATVAVDPVAAFQLALFATDERLRNAAAESLWPREHVDRCEMEVNDADFDSLLPHEYHGSALAPGNPASDFKSMQAFRHIGNTDSITRIIGFDARNRRVHYFLAQIHARESAEGRLVGDVPDTIEEELRK